MVFNAKDYKWNDDTPKNCPPSVAKSVDGQYYRAVKNIPADDSDFLRWIDEPHNITKPKTCTACGVSVYSTLEGVVNMMERFPKRWSKFPTRGVVRGKLDPIVGVISQEGKDPQHYNLWVQKKVVLMKYFNHTI